MLLTGWTPAPVNEDAQPVSNGESSSNAPEKLPGTREDSDEISTVPADNEIALSGSKRKLSESSDVDGGVGCSACTSGIKGSNQKPEEVDDGDDDVVMLDENPDKRQRLQ